MAVTLKEIARQANVSVATVSMALNNKQGVGAKKRQSILKIARELGYGQRAAQSRLPSYARSNHRCRPARSRARKAP